MNNDFAFMMFAMEQEGLTDTHEGRINRAIKYVQEGYDIDEALTAVGYTSNDITPNELRRIAGMI